MPPTWSRMFGGLAAGGSRSGGLGVHGRSAQGHAECEAWIVDVPTVCKVKRRGVTGVGDRVIAAVA